MLVYELYQVLTISLSPSIPSPSLSLSLTLSLSLLPPSFFQLENVDVVVADHVQRVMKPNFAASWEEIGDENQVEETFALSSMKDIQGLL